MALLAVVTLTEVACSLRLARNDVFAGYLRHVRRQDR